MSNDIKPVDPIDECVRLGRELARVQDEYKEMLDEAVVVERERNALKRENAALRLGLEGAQMSLDNWIAASASHAVRVGELEAENAALKQRIIDDNKAYGCEIRDPSGTIWDHAQKLQKENAELRVDKERLDWFEDWGYGYDGLLERGWGIGLPQNQKGNTRNLRAAIDAAQKEAQP